MHRFNFLIHEWSQKNAIPLSVFQYRNTREECAAELIGGEGCNSGARSGAFHDSFFGLAETGRLIDRHGSRGELPCPSKIKSARDSRLRCAGQTQREQTSTPEVTSSSSPRNRVGVWGIVRWTGELLTPTIGKRSPHRYKSARNPRTMCNLKIEFPFLLWLSLVLGAREDQLLSLGDNFDIRAVWAVGWERMRGISSR